MNPGLVVKLRPAGPWRIGPDSGARNKVDAIYHSDSLFSAVESPSYRPKRNGYPEKCNGSLDHDVHCGIVTSARSRAALP